MIGQSNNLLRKQRISPRQIRILQTLWSAKLRRAGKRPRPESSREARLHHISQILGREVKSSKELSWRQANGVIHRLLEEIGPRRIPTQESAAESGAAAGAESSGVLSTSGGPSDAQLWKIRQIEQYLGWSHPGGKEARLAGFLRAKFHVDQPEQLSPDQAWRAIEALCAVGARERIKARRGKAHPVGHEGLTREVATLKQELQDWRAA